MSIDEPSTSCDISGTSVDTSKTKSTETLTVIDVDGNQYDKPSGRIIFSMMNDLAVITGTRNPGKIYLVFMNFFNHQ